MNFNNINTVLNRSEFVFYTVYSMDKINLSKIVSRPAKTKLGEYVFFIDCDGHIKDPILGAVYQEMVLKTSFLNCLGSYPKEKEC